MNRKTTQLISKLAVILLVFGFFTQNVSAGQGALLGLNPGIPQLDFSSFSAPGCTYDSTNDLLTVTSQPSLALFGPLPAGPAGFIIGGSMTLTANIDAAGTLSGGTFVVNGTVNDSSGPTLYGPVLLTGTFTGGDYGMVDVTMDLVNPGTDQADFRIILTGGTMAPLYAGSDIGVNLTMELSDYAGNMTNDWTCQRAKGIIGTIEPLNVDLCDLVLTKTVDPDEIGPLVPVGNDSDSDSDSDSGIDGNGNNDTDDSDSDSGEDTDSGDGMPPVCGCKGKVDELLMQYNGVGPVDIVVTDKVGDIIYTENGLTFGSTFTLIGMDKHNTLGPKIFISIDGGETVELHTSCSEPIGPGLIAGDFEVISGGSRKLTVGLCPVSGPVCPPGQLVTYTYVVDNNGSAVTDLTVVDDILGLVGGPVDLPAGGQVIFMETACIFETTTNTAIANSTLGADACNSNESSATVVVLDPPDDCTGTDTDSDSGIDGNGNGDSDDSDSDSGDCDLDGDSDNPPDMTMEGCTPGYWKQSQHFDSWVGYSQLADKFDDVFDVDAAGNKSLLSTLQATGGKSKALGRHAVAALLNASNPDVNYLYSVNDVFLIVQDAYVTFDFNGAKNLLEDANQDGCPLN